jgi:hypothetical protein
LVQVAGGKPEPVRLVAGLDLAFGGCMGFLSMSDDVYGPSNLVCYPQGGAVRRVKENLKLKR